MISLKAIGKKTESECIALQVTDEQLKFVASNERSLNWAKSNPRCVALAVCLESQVVGFLMYEPRGNDVFSIHRVMVDAKYQRQGIGRRAMELAIERINNLGGVTIYLSFRPENHTARQLFQSLGFVEHEIEPDGEVVCRLGPSRELAY